MTQSLLFQKKRHNNHTASKQLYNCLTCKSLPKVLGFLAFEGLDQNLVNILATKYNRLLKKKKKAYLFFWQPGKSDLQWSSPPLQQHSFLKLSQFSSDLSSLFCWSQCLLQPFNAGILEYILNIPTLTLFHFSFNMRFNYSIR